MNILVINGTAEGYQLGQLLSAHRLIRHVVISSLSDLRSITGVHYHQHTNANHQQSSLPEVITGQNINLVIDASHPYAQNISHRIAEACQQTATPLWAIRRPPWHAKAGDEWYEFDHWHSIRRQLDLFTLPLITLAREAKNHLQQLQAAPTLRPQPLNWLVRCLPPLDNRHLPRYHGVRYIFQRGPFYPWNEYRLLKSQRCDVVICKNSGGPWAVGKLLAARKLKLPVLLLRRPKLPEVNREFTHVALLIKALEQQIQ